MESAVKLPKRDLDLDYSDAPPEQLAVFSGLPPEKAQNFQAVTMAPWLLLPGLFVVLAVLAFNVVGDGMRDAADPYGS